MHARLGMESFWHFTHPSQQLSLIWVLSRVAVALGLAELGKEAEAERRRGCRRGEGS